MRRMIMCGAAVLGVGAGVAMMASGQPQDGKPAGAPAAPGAQPPTPPPSPAAPDKAEPPKSPAPNKKLAPNAPFDPAVVAEFKALEGTWDVDVTLRLQPGVEPIKTTAVLTSKVIMDGMFLEQVMEGAALPALGNKAWSSRSIYGYNAAQGVLQAVRMSNNNSVMIPVRGVYHAGDPKFELAGSYQLMGMNCTQRDVTTVESPDKRRVESYMAFGNMPEFKGFEMVATRRK